MGSRASRPLCVAAVLAASAVAVGGCGGEPQYCSDRSDLEQSVRAIGDVPVLQSGGAQELKSQLQKVDSDARALVSSAKSDFPSETSAIESSVSTLKSTVEGLRPSPTPEQLARAAADTKATVTAVQNFSKATESNCS